MNIVVFDTETTSLEKPLCYNIGYVIGDENGNILLHRDFVVEQIWHNLPLFSTAYYADKRPIYVNAMRRHETVMDKWGYIMQTMRRDFAKYEVVGAYAYNSPFDDGVFEMNCDWFKTNNPFEKIPLFDIRGYAHQFIVNADYLNFCDEHGFYTDAGNYSTTAENVYRSMTDVEFVEDHTALSDSRIEKDILFECFKRGAKVNTEYEVKRSIERRVTKTLQLIDTEKKSHYFDYERMTISKDKTKITLR